MNAVPSARMVALRRASFALSAAVAQRAPAGCGGRLVRLA